MIVGGVARRYADALFEIGVEEGNYRDLLEEFRTFYDVLSGSEEASEILKSSIYNAREKMNVLTAILDARSYSDTLVRFLKMLLTKRRMFFVGQILDGFTALVEAHEGIERVEVTVPSPLDRETKSSIADTLGKSMGKKIVLEENVDPSIIGGLIVKAGSTVFDGSIKTQIHRLGENLKKG